jgi:double-stranded uracil-DNA glycosylase
MPILPDVLQPHLKIVFCGTAVGARSAKIGAYYAGPGNRFWPTLFQVGLIPRQLRPQDYRSLVDYGIGLTDIAKDRSGGDHVLTPADFDGLTLRAKIEQFAPKVLAFNGKRAAQEFYGRKVVAYGRQPERLGATTVFVLPSTSGAARGFWDERYWQALAEFVKNSGGIQIVEHIPDPKLDRFDSWVMEMDNTIGHFLATLSGDIRQKLDYSRESLDVIEDWILKTYPNRDALLAKNQRKIVDGAACYIGETFRKHLGGYWGVRYDSANRPEPVIEGFDKHGSIVSPDSLIATLVSKKRGVGYLQVVLVFWRSQSS